MNFCRGADLSRPRQSTEKYRFFEAPLVRLSLVSRMASACGGANRDIFNTGQAINFTSEFAESEEFCEVSADCSLKSAVEPVPAFAVFAVLAVYGNKITTVTTELLIMRSTS